MSSRVPPGIRIHQESGTLSELGRLSGEHYYHRNVYGHYNELESPFYSPASLSVTINNTGNDNHPVGAPRGLRSFTTQTYYISSENLNDDDVVAVEGLDAAGRYKYATAQLNGFSAVSLGSDWIWANRAWILNGLPNGDVWVGNDAATVSRTPPGRPIAIANRVLRITANPPYRTSATASYVVPADYKALILGYNAYIIAVGNNKRREGICWIETRTSMGIAFVIGGGFRTTPWRTRNQIGLISKGTDAYTRRFKNPISLSPFEEVRLRYLGEGGNTIVKGSLGLQFHRLED